MSPSGMVVPASTASMAPSVHWKTTNLECAPSPKYFHNHSCRLKAINRYKTMAFMETYVKNSLRNISVNVGMYYRNDVNIYKPYLVNFTSNLCQFMDRKVSGLYINALMRILRKYTNVNHECPYEGYLIAKNIHADIDLIPLPPLLSKNSYKFLLIFYEGYPYDYMGRVTFYIDIINTRN
ncbi:uncharacterized protein LOC135961418 [Calliphora vicina]|uniref:uncharacterized protein LOC135961418 n=1 Tax=Calliphora vicina TaxID=7373 RepID=UPI00325ADB1B